MKYNFLFVPFIFEIMSAIYITLKIFNPHCESLKIEQTYIEPLTTYTNSNNYVTLSRKDILNATSNQFASGTTVKWDEFSQFKDDVANGEIPVELLSDPVYCSMNLPSETQSDYMISINRDNGHIIGDTQSPETSQVLGIGAAYKTSGRNLPNNFSIYLGKIKVFAYSQSEQRWKIICALNHPSDAQIYTLPWTNTKNSPCKNITVTKNYLKIDLTSSDLNNAVLHFWGKSVPIDKHDYSYYACAYDFWVSENVAEKLTFTNGIDAKNYNSSKTIIQLYSITDFTDFQLERGNSMVLFFLNINTVSYYS